MAQLTRHFQIITKTKNSDYRLVAEVVLRTYTEDNLASVANPDDVKFRTGTVRIKAIPAEKKSSHGTEIILLDLKQQTKDLLRSRDVWLGIESGPISRDRAVRGAFALRTAARRVGREPQSDG